LDAYENIELYQGNVEIILPELEIHPDLAVVDPPRAGIAPAGMKALIKSRPDQVIYVSCDPSTLARDLKIMVQAGYSIESITPVDMFPQTYHIETISALHRIDK
jgi:23S rRNA (uracil1939-C5)-methyltransferase